MAKRGPKPKPTALKILEGFQPCRINRDEPAFPPGSLTPPEWLDAIAAEKWAELAPLLATAGVLTDGDRTALAMLCDDFSKARSDPDDHKARDRVRRLLVEFGLTPSSRSRIRVATPKPADDLEAFLAKKA